MLPALIILIIVFSFLTVQRNIVWRNDLSLWNDAVAKSPLSARAHDNLGLAWMGIKNMTLRLRNSIRRLRLILSIILLIIMQE